MLSAKLEELTEGLPFPFYPEEIYTIGDTAALLGVPVAEVKELARGSRLNAESNTTGIKIKGLDIAAYLLNHNGFDRLAMLGYKYEDKNAPDKKQVALAIQRDMEFFSHYLALAELTELVGEQGIKVPELNGDRRKSKLVLTTILALLEKGPISFREVVGYCAKEMPYYPVERGVVSGILNKQLKDAGIAGKRHGIYYLIK